MVEQYWYWMSFNEFKYSKYKNSNYCWNRLNIRCIFIYNSCITWSSIFRCTYVRRKLSKIFEIFIHKICLVYVNDNNNEWILILDDSAITCNVPIFLYFNDGYAIFKNILLGRTGGYNCCRYNANNGTIFPLLL